jgi:hypothetical protein
MRGLTLNRDDSSTDLLRAIDWEHLAAEIEGLAHRQRQDLAAGLGVVVEHLVRLEFSPTWEPRDAWIAMLRRERIVWRRSCATARRCGPRCRT